MIRPARYEVWLVNLEPTRGSEVQKTRPCVVVSPDEMNKWIRTIIIVPLTSAKKKYVSRVPVDFQGVGGQAMVDQIRAVDKLRLVRKLGKIDPPASKQISDTIVEFFS